MHGLCSYDTEALAKMIIVENDFKILQVVSLCGKHVFILHFTWNLVLFSSYPNWPKFPSWSLAIQHRHATLLSTYGVI